jgi:hypothetical protein
MWLSAAAARGDGAATDIASVSPPIWPAKWAKLYDPGPLTLTTPTN